MATAKPHQSNARRREVRRTVLTARQRWLERLAMPALRWSALYVLVLTCAGGLLAISAQHWPRYRVGQVVGEPIVSRVQFVSVNEQNTNAARAAQRQREPAVYVANQEFLDQVRAKLMNLGRFSLDAAIDNIDDVNPQVRTAWALTPQVFNTLKRLGDNDAAQQRWQELVDRFLDGLAGIAVLAGDDYVREMDRTQLAYQIVIVHPYRHREESRLDETLLSSTEDLSELENRVRTIAHAALPEDLRVLAGSFVAIVMESPQPLYRMDLAQTQQRRDEAAATAPVIEDHLTAHQMLVWAGHRLTQADLRLIRSEQAAYREQFGLTVRLANVVRIALVLLISVGLWAYTYNYNRRIAENPMRGLALTSLLLLALALAVLAMRLAPDYAYAFAIYPTLSSVIILAIAYDRRYALALGMLHTLLVVVSLGLSVGFGMTLITGVAVAVSQLGDVRNRSKLLWVGLWSGLAMAAVVWMTGLIERPVYLVGDGGQLNLIGWDAAKALLTGLCTGLLVQGALPAIEQVFKVTTAMTLKELNDASHPLLRHLAQDVPGTYQHSLRLADLTESAAEAIGADALLCKVGAMYHDIGKIIKPAYFVENQSDGLNRHGKLSPAMSLLIIVGHVKDGVELAREYGLPPSVRHFIESHHGTTLVEYFYHAAKQQSDQKHTPAPTEFEFRYPGPKPATREAAILMLGDAIESSARTLAEPTPVRLEQLAHTMARKRLMDGQFDQCGITLSELSAIEAAMAKTLSAVYHARVRYPVAPIAVPAAS